MLSLRGLQHTSGVRDALGSAVRRCCKADHTAIKSSRHISRLITPVRCAHASRMRRGTASEGSGCVHPRTGAAAAGPAT